jgi:N-acyl-D-amino-acid deacylase
VRQGVTTIVVGADGSSRAPSGNDEGDGTNTVRALLERINALPPGLNVGTCVGLGTVRGAVVGQDDRPASRPSSRAWSRWWRRRSPRAHSARPPASSTRPVPSPRATNSSRCAVRWPRAIRTTTRTCATRMISSSRPSTNPSPSRAVPAAGCRSPISRRRARATGASSTPSSRVAEARAAGVDVAFDRYPYLAYQTGLTNLFPVWTRDGGIERFFARLDDPATAARIRTEAQGRADAHRRLAERADHQRLGRRGQGGRGPAHGGVRGSRSARTRTNSPWPCCAATAARWA